MDLVSFLPDEHAYEMSIVALGISVEIEGGNCIRKLSRDDGHLRGALS